MKTNMQSALWSVAAAIMLSACSRHKPQTISNAAVVESQIVAPGSLNDFQKNVGDSVYFKFDSAKLSPEAHSTLQKQSQFLNTYPQYKSTIVGHCDERGTEEYNMALGARRAHAAHKALVKMGVSGDRLRTYSVGKNQPLCTGSNEEAWQLNRCAITMLEDQSGQVLENDRGMVPLAVIHDGKNVPVTSPSAQ
jgi:peptidoglycan-associated lipoprotein